MSTSVEEMKKKFEEALPNLLKAIAFTKLSGFLSFQQINAIRFMIKALQDFFQNIKATDWLNKGNAILGKVIITPVAAASLLEIAIRIRGLIALRGNPQATHDEIKVQVLESLFATVIGTGVGVLTAVNYGYLGEDDDMFTFANSAVLTPLLSVQTLLWYILWNYFSNLAEDQKNTVIKSLSRKGLYEQGVALMSELSKAPLSIEMGKFQNRTLQNFLVSQHKKTDDSKEITLSNNDLSHVNDFTTNSIMANRHESMFNASNYMLLLSIIITALQESEVKGSNISVAFAYQILTGLFAFLLMNVNHLFTTGASHSQRKANIEDGSVAANLSQSLQKAGIVKREARETDPLLLKGQIQDHNNNNGDAVVYVGNGAESSSPSARRGFRYTPSDSE